MSSGNKLKVINYVLVLLLLFEFFEVYFVVGKPLPLVMPFLAVFNRLDVELAHFKVCQLDFVLFDVSFSQFCSLFNLLVDFVLNSILSARIHSVHHCTVHHKTHVYSYIETCNHD